MLLEVAVQEVDVSVRHLGQVEAQDAWAMVEAAALHDQPQRPDLEFDGMEAVPGGEHWTEPALLFRRPDGHVFRMTRAPHRQIMVSVLAEWTDRVLVIIPRPRQAETTVGPITMDEAHGLLERFGALDTPELVAWVEITLPQRFAQ